MIRPDMIRHVSFADKGIGVRWSREDILVFDREDGEDTEVRFAGQLVTVPAALGRRVIVVAANAYRMAVSDPNVLFLTKMLVPSSCRPVPVGEIGKVLMPGKDPDGSLVRTPPIESFPTCLHSTGFARDGVVEWLGKHGIDARPWDLVFSPAIVALGRGWASDAEWGDEAMMHLMDMSSGDMASCTLNADGNMSVCVLGAIDDFMQFARDATMDMYLRSYARLLRFGDDNGRMRRLVGNLLYSMPRFVIQESEGKDPRRLAQEMLTMMRMRKDAAAISHSRIPLAKAEVEVTGTAGLQAVVSVAAISGTVGDVVALGVERDRNGLLPIIEADRELLQRLGAMICSKEEARSVIDATYNLVTGNASQTGARVLIDALLGSRYGNMALCDGPLGQPRDGGLRPKGLVWTPQGGGEAPIAGDACALLAVISASEFGDVAWADWACGKVRDVIGSARYASALAEAIDAAIAILPLDIEDVPCEVPTPEEWARLGELARGAYAKVQAAHKPKTGPDDDEGYWDIGSDYGEDPYDDFPYGDEYDKTEEFESRLEEATSATEEDAALLRKAQGFRDVCALYYACRVPLRHIDETVARELLDRQPALSLVLDDRTKPKPVSIDAVACCYDAFIDLVTGLDRGLGDASVILPDVVMDDGSVIRMRIEGRDDEQYVGRIAHDGGGMDEDEDLFLTKADGQGFRSPYEVLEFLFEIAASGGEVG